jgi:hypothetical protein
MDGNEPSDGLGQTPMAVFSFFPPFCTRLNLDNTISNQRSSSIKLYGKMTLK